MREMKLYIYIYIFYKINELHFFRNLGKNIFGVLSEVTF